jgi:hypothetical protein
MPPFVEQESEIKWPIGGETRVTWIDLVTIVVVIRLYHVVRFIYSQSPYFLPTAQFYTYSPLSHLFGIYNSPKFIILTQMKKRPFGTIMVVSGSIMLLSGLVYHIMERTASEELLVYDGPYFIAITQLTVGFGDITPKSDFGRLIAMGPGLCAMLTLSLVMTYTLKFIEMSPNQKKMVKILIHKALIYSKQANLAAVFLQRWWRLRLSRRITADPLRLKRLLDCKIIHELFKRKFAVDLQGITPELEAQISTFQSNMQDAFHNTSKQLQDLRRFSEKAGYFSTNKFDIVAKMLTIKHIYLRCRLIGSAKGCERSLRSVTHIRKKHKRSSIGEKKASDMAVKRLKVRLSMMPSAENLDSISSETGRKPGRRSSFE